MSQFSHLIAPRKVNLSKLDPASTKQIPARDKADPLTVKAAARIGELQDVMYAQGRWSFLVILQGMDASGKDGTVRRVFDNVNPEGISVTSFKAPSGIEVRHDFLWRAHIAVPPRGLIGIFNRSYYEEVLIVRVHADKFLPKERRESKHIWQDRYSLINGFEELLELNETRVLKFFLHISKDEQRQRFEDRQRDPAKHWKLAAGDFEERKFWSDYQDAYARMLEETSTDRNPWYIIPADRNWVRNYWISQIIVDEMEKLKMKYPPAADKELLKRKFK